jgi:hypothetical protein
VVTQRLVFFLSVDRSHSIPEAPRGALALTERAGRAAMAPNQKEVVSMKTMAQHVRSWIASHGLLIVLILSVVHVGVASLHARDSGGGDQQQEGVQGHDVTAQRDP